MAARIRPKSPIHIHAYIREWRRYKTMSQEELAGRLGDEGSNKGTVSRWENLKRRPDEGTLQAICEALDIPREKIHELPPSKPAKLDPKSRKLTKAEKKMAEQLVADFLARRRVS